jgi:urease accessory protein
VNPVPPLPIIDRVHRDASLPDACRGFARDSITLGWQERVQAHGRRQSDGGREFGLSLPRGSILRAGDVLVFDEARAVVVVVERPEPVFVIEPRSAPEWGLYAYHIGNRHQPLMITDRSIVCPDVPGVAELLDQQHIPYTRALLPFTPATAAVGHQH